MKQLFRLVTWAVITSILLSACAGAAGPASTDTSAAQSPASTATSEPSASATPQLPTTQIIIDGDASDWAVYRVNATDPTGDQLSGAADLGEVKYFFNDKYFYMLITFAPGDWDDLAIGAEFTGVSGQININTSNQVSIRRYDDGSQTFPFASAAVAENAIELKIGLDQFPAQLVGVRDIVFYEANQELDNTTNATMGSLRSVQEIEPTLQVTQITIDGDASDWAHYPISIADPSGDQSVGGADLGDVRYFLNDKFLYLLVQFAQVGDWNNIAVGTGGVGQSAQISIRDSQHNTFTNHEDGSEKDLNTEIVITENLVEFKVSLDQFPARLSYVGDIRIFGDQLVDDSSNTEVGPLATVMETEPIVQVSGSSLSGAIQTDETWSGEVHVTGDIRLAQGVTLTIEPGTTVFLASNSDDQHIGLEHIDDYIGSHNDPVGTAEWDQNAITIDGRDGIIHFVGTAQEPIVFRPEGNSTSTAQWDGIYIERGTIQYSRVLYAGRTAIQALGFVGEPIEIAYNEVRFFHWAGIDSQTPNVWIHHNVVEGGGHQAIGAASGNVVEYNLILRAQGGISVQANGLDIRNNIFVDCARGIQISGRTPSGSEINIVNNTFAQIDGPPDGWYYQDTLIYPAFDEGGAIEVQVPGVKLTAINNLIFGAYTWGIGVHQALGAGSVVDYNLIFGTDGNYMGSGTGAIGSHNIFGDPRLTDDYHLLPGSAAIDAGAPGTLDEDGSPADLGAYGGEFAYGW